MGGEVLLSWAATYALHSTLLLGGAWLATRRGPLAGSSARDAIWKIASTGALLTATLQLAVPAAGPSLEWKEPAPGPREAVVSGAAAAAVERAAVPVEIPTTGRAPSNPRPAPADLHPRAPTNVVPEPVASGALAAPGAAPFVTGYLVLAVLLLARHARVRRRFQARLGERREIDDGPARDALDAVLRRAGTRRQVRLTATRSTTSPVALRGNEICIPERALTELDRRSLHALLAHELAHLERRDPVWIEIAAMLQSVLFLQPLHRVGRRELRAAAEEECDAWAARVTGERQAVARCLVEVAGWLRLARMEAAGMAEQGRGLERRVERLIGASGRRGSRRAGVLAGLGLVAAIACGGPAVRPADDGPAPAEPVPPGPAVLATPPSVTAAPPGAPAPEANVAPPAAARPDAVQPPDRVRVYVWGGEEDEPWFAFDWTPEGVAEEMARLGKTLRKGLEPLADLDVRIAPDLSEALEVYVQAPRILGLAPVDSLGIRVLGLGSWTGPDPRLEVRIEGEVGWGEGTVTSLSPGGRVEITDRREEPSRRLVVTPGADGGLDFDYELDGRPHAFDEAARGWLKDVVGKVRTAGGKGGARVRRIPDVVYRERGDAGVFRWAPGHRAPPMPRVDREELLRSHLRALEREVERLREEIERLEAEDRSS